MRELREVLIGVKETAIDRAVLSPVCTSRHEHLDLSHSQLLNELSNTLVRMIHDRENRKRRMRAYVRALDRMTNRIEEVCIRRRALDDGVKLSARNTHLCGYTVQKRDAKWLHCSWREYLTEPIGGIKRNVRSSNKDDHFLGDRAQHAVASPSPTENLQIRGTAPVSGKRCCLRKRSDLANKNESTKSRVVHGINDRHRTSGTRVNEKTLVMVRHQRVDDLVRNIGSTVESHDVEMSIKGTMIKHVDSTLQRHRALDHATIHVEFRRVWCTPNTRRCSHRLLVVKT